MLPLFFIIWFCYDMFYFKSGFIKCSDMDFESGKRPDLDDIVGAELDNYCGESVQAAESTTEKIQ